MLTWHPLWSNITQTLHKCRKGHFILIKPLWIYQVWRRDSGNNVWPQEFYRAVTHKIHKHLCQATGTASYTSGFMDKWLPRNISLWPNYCVLVGLFTQLWWGNLPSIHVSTSQTGCQLPMYKSLSTLVYVCCHGGLEKLNFISPPFKTETVLKMPSAWTLLTAHFTYIFLSSELILSNFPY